MLLISQVVLLSHPAPGRLTQGRDFLLSGSRIFSDESPNLDPKSEIIEKFQ